MSTADPAPRRAGLRRAWLITSREFRERVTQKAYRIALLVGAIAAAAAVIVPTLFDDDSGAESASVVAIAVQGGGSDSDTRIRALETAAKSVRGTPLAFERYRDDQAIRKAIGDGDHSVGLILSGTIDDPLAYVVSRQDAGGPLAAQLAQAVDIAVQTARIDAGGLDAAEVQAPAEVRPEFVEGAGPTTAATAVVSVLGLLLYIAGILLTQSYATGIVTDRTNRVTERLLTAAKPFEHLAGKLVGVGAAGLLQFAVWIIAALVADQVAGSGTALDDAPAALIAFFPVALVLTYVLYAAAVSILVLPVRKSEDVGGAVTPAVMLQVIGFVMTTAIVAPGSTVPKAIEYLSLVPFFSPLLMLARLAGGDVPGWQLAIGIIGPIVLSAILLRVAAPAYARYAIDAPGGKGLKAALASLRS